MADERTRIEEQLVTIVSLTDIVQADLIRSWLESAGVDVFMANENVGALHHPLMLMQPIEIQVPESQAGRARDALAEMVDAVNNEDADYDDDEEDASAAPQPELRFHSYGHRGPLAFAVLAAAMALAVYIALRLLEMI